MTQLETIETWRTLQHLLFNPPNESNFKITERNYNCISCSRLLNSIESSPLITSLEANGNFQLNSIVILQARARHFTSLQLERVL